MFRLVSLCFQATGTSFFDCRLSSVQCRHGDRETRTAIVVGASSFCFVSSNYHRQSAPACTQRSILLVSLTSLSPPPPPHTPSPPHPHTLVSRHVEKYYVSFNPTQGVFAYTQKYCVCDVFQPMAVCVCTQKCYPFLSCLPILGGLWAYNYAPTDTTRTCLSCLPTQGGLCVYPEMLPLCAVCPHNKRSVQAPRNTARVCRVSTL